MRACMIVFPHTILCCNTCGWRGCGSASGGGVIHIFALGASGGGWRRVQLRVFAHWRLDPLRPPTGIGEDVVHRSYGRSMRYLFPTVDYVRLVRSLIPWAFRAARLPHTPKQLMYWDGTTTLRSVIVRHRAFAGDYYKS